MPSPAWENPVVAVGAVEGLRQLSNVGVSVGVVTNGSSHIQLLKLQNSKNSGLSKLLDASVCADQVGVRKPDSAIFIAACARLRIDPTQSWLVGTDPELDIVGAARLA